MRIHLLSDLHNEFERFVPLVTDADVTILAGDIDVKGRGVAWAREAFSGLVLYVPGNHEFYGGHLTRTLAKMRAAGCERVRVLDREVITHQGVRFLCATGWTDFTATGNAPLAQWDAQQQMQDYKAIRYHDTQFRKLRPEVTAAEAHATHAWLREQLMQPFDGKTVVVTHHAPSMLSTPNSSTGTLLDAAYVNRWEHLFGEGLDLWVHGHTHEAIDYTVEGTRVISNPRGYHGIEHVEGFDPSLVLEL